MLKRSKSNLKKHMNAGKLFCILALIFPITHFLFFTIISNGGTFVLAFQEFNINTGSFEWVGMKNFVVIPRVLFSPLNEFPIALRNSFLFFILNNFIILPLSLFTAILCYKRLPMGSFFRVIFYLPNIISPVIIAMVVTFSFDTSIGFISNLFVLLGKESSIPILGWLADSATAMPILLTYCLWIGIGGPIIILTGAINKIPQHLYELNKLYGLGLIKEVWYVILPLIGTTISILFLQGISVILGFFLPVLLITGGAAQTTTIGMFLIGLVRGSRMNYGFAASITIVSTLILSPIILSCKYGIGKLFPSYEY